MKNEILELGILSKIRFPVFEFCEKWDFENVNFCRCVCFTNLRGGPYLPDKNLFRIVGALEILEPTKSSKI